MYMSIAVESGSMSQKTYCANTEVEPMAAAAILFFGSASGGSVEQMD
jgi:hypothetical protein